MTADDARPGNPLAGVPPAVWAVTALFALILLSWSFLVPTYRAPDEPQHVSTALRLEGGGGYPPPGRAFVEREVVASVVAAGTAFDGRSEHPVSLAGFRLDRVGGAAAPERHARPTFSDLRRPAPTVLRDQMTQHPPLYYLAGAAVHRAAPESTSFLARVHLQRLLGVVFTSTLPVCVFLAARRVLRRDGPAVAAAMVPACVPMLTHIGSVASNDTLLVGLFGAVTLAVAHVVTGDLSRRTAVLAGGVVALTLLTKATGLVALLWVLLAYAVAGARLRSARAALVPAAVFAGVSGLGAWWWLLNLARHGALQPDGFQRPRSAEPVSADLGEWAGVFREQLAQRFWGAFGWQEVPISATVVTTATTVLLAALALGVLRPAGRRAVVAVLMVPAVLLLASVARASWTAYPDAGFPPGIHGRYLFPAVAAVAVVAVGGLGRLCGRWAFALPVPVLAAALAMQAHGMHRALTGFWDGGEPGVLSSAEAMLAWAPWHPLLHLAVLLATAATAVAVAGLLLRDVAAGLRSPRSGYRDRRLSAA